MAGPTTMERYAKEQLPIGSEKTLGYMVWGLARALTLMGAGETSKAHLVLLPLLGAVEQFKLDGAWASAWAHTPYSAAFLRLARQGGPAGQPIATRSRSHSVVPCHLDCSGDRQTQGRRSPKKRRFQGHPEPPNRPDKPPRRKGGRGKGAAEAPDPKQQG